jgi:membrane protease YdiL (CAAX protease family)
MQVPVETDLRRGPARTFPLAAWAVIVVATSILMVMAATQGGGQAEEGVAGGDDPLLEIEARLVLAQEAIAPGSSRQIFDDVLGKSPPARKLRLSALATALYGPEVGKRVLGEVQEAWAASGVSRTDSERSILDDLDRLYAGDAGEAAKSRVETELGWFGKLAVIGSMTDSDQRRDLLAPIMEAAAWMMFALIGLLMVLGGLGVAGLALLVVAIVRASRGLMQSSIAPRTSFDGVYAETFAVWLVGFEILMVVAGGVARELPATDAMSVTFIAFMLSLIALWWPIWRGVSWQQVRTDIGWTGGAGVVRELGCGLVGYMAALPIAGVGLLISMGLILFAAPEEGARAAAHPIVNELAGGGWWIRIQVLMVASIAAPIVEETMFRGVLYRQVRSWSGDRSLPVTIAISAGLTSLIFALIHPQGVLAVPALMALAIAFCLAREWRGSVIAPMVMHGVSNGIVMTMLMVMI